VHEIVDFYRAEKIQTAFILITGFFQTDFLQVKMKLTLITGTFLLNNRFCFFLTFFVGLTDCINILSLLHASGIKR